MGIKMLTRPAQPRSKFLYLRSACLSRRMRRKPADSPSVIWSITPGRLPTHFPERLYFEGDAPLEWHSDIAEFPLRSLISPGTTADKPRSIPPRPAGGLVRVGRGWESAGALARGDKRPQFLPPPSSLRARQRPQHPI
jgi:hypothetical protein